MNFEKSVKSIFELPCLKGVVENAKPAKKTTSNKTTSVDHFLDFLINIFIFDLHHYFLFVLIIVLLGTYPGSSNKADFSS